MEQEHFQIFPEQIQQNYYPKIQVFCVNPRHNSELEYLSVLCIHQATYNPSLQCIHQLELADIIAMFLVILAWCKLKFLYWQMLALHFLECALQIRSTSYSQPQDAKKANRYTRSIKLQWCLFLQARNS